MPNPSVTDVCGGQIEVKRRKRRRGGGIEREEGEDSSLRRPKWETNPI